MKINNVELEDLDIMDFEMAERYEKALETVKDESAKIKYESLKGSEIIKIQCNIIFGLFNTLFGEGTDKKVFGDKINYRVCMDSFEELVNNMNKEAEKNSKYIKEKAEKYSPNRAIRRNKK